MHGELLLNLAPFTQEQGRRGLADLNNAPGWLNDPSTLQTRMKHNAEFHGGVTHNSCGCPRVC